MNTEQSSETKKLPTFNLDKPELHRAVMLSEIKSKIEEHSHGQLRLISSQPKDMVGYKKKHPELLLKGGYAFAVEKKGLLGITHSSNQAVLSAFGEAFSAAGINNPDITQCSHTKLWITGKTLDSLVKATRRNPELINVFAEAFTNSLLISKSYCLS